MAVAFSLTSMQAVGVDSGTENNKGLMRVPGLLIRTTASVLLAVTANPAHAFGYHLHRLTIRDASLHAVLAPHGSAITPAMDAQSDAPRSRPAPLAPR
jgi:hypothetical protein